MTSVDWWKMPNSTESKRLIQERKRESLRNLFISLFCRSTFSDFAHRYSKDERFRGVEKTRERESLFNEFIVEVRRKEKDERDSNREKVHFPYIPLQWLFIFPWSIHKIIEAIDNSAIMTMFLRVAGFWDPVSFELFFFYLSDALVLGVLS